MTGVQTCALPICDIVMINHVLHDYAERVSNAARHHSMRLCWYTTSWVHDAVTYICKVFMKLIILTVVVKVDASDIVMINHVLHDYAERVSNAARHHSMRLCWYTTSWVHDAVMYICKVFMNLIILTVLVKIDASDIVMINHVLHDYAERVSNAEIGRAHV